MSAHAARHDRQALAAIIFDFEGVIVDRERLHLTGASILCPGAAHFIPQAAARVPIAVASGAVTQEVEITLKRAGLGGLFVAVVGADQTQRSKPSPDPYLEAFHRIRAAGHDVDPRRTIAIEDSIWGLVSARTAGLRCVGVTTTCSAAKLAPHAELVVTGLDALTLDALDNLVLRE